MVWDKNKMKKSIKISNKLWLLLSKYYFVYILMALFVSIALVIFVCLRDDFNVTDVIELSAFSAVVLESILSGVAKIVQKRAANKVEDPSKLTIDYDSLMKIYHNSKNRMIMCSDGTLIPVIIEEWLYDKEIIIDDLYEYEYKLPELVVRYYYQFLSAHDTSNIYNNINIRINDWSTNGNKFIIVTGRTTYYNSLVTNRVMDYKLDNGISIRQLYECGPYVRPISKSVLSNHIGFNGFIESADGYFAFVFRGKNVSIGKRTWANSIGASLKAKYALDDYRFSAQGLENGILCEIKDELKIDRNNLVRIHGQFEKITIVAAYRDLIEGGKPQLLFYAKSKLTKKQITKGFFDGNSNVKNRIKSVKNERDRKEIEMETDGKLIKWISRKDIIYNINIYPDRIVHNGTEMSMLPSATACVKMLKEYLVFIQGLE